MLVIGSYNELVVEREVEFGFYLNPKEDEVLLPAKYAPKGLRPGDTLRVFVYTDSEDRPIATTLTPLAVVGDFVCLQVKDIQPFGAFLEWGLEKDLLLPKSEMPRPVNPGDRVVVKVCLDTTTNRVYATAQLSGHIEKNLEALSEGERVDLMIYNITDLGIQALINNRYSGMLFHSDTFEPLCVGEKTVGYIHHIKEDGKIDLLLKMPGYGSVSDSATRIQDRLKIEGGVIPVNDKSSPEMIKEWFSMSKKEFKRAIGGLYKNRIIRITDTGICLINPNETAINTPPESSPWEKAMKKRS
ncbi:S1-like domain-containing RNA-binding protein [Desulfobacula sp.]|uniref:CvfB family protein n=1 Tax=Desulfobacula sp. TaxID=2593537 RepID=UPI002631B3A5|nr:S1-like domain-containing RNA-binding protein [Desulfobacula sp.]